MVLYQLCCRRISSIPHKKKKGRHGLDVMAKLNEIYVKSKVQIFCSTKQAISQQHSVSYTQSKTTARFEVHSSTLPESSFMKTFV